MRGRLEERRAVVTAAGQGIGRAIAVAFAREGAEVWAIDRNAAALDGVPLPAGSVHSCVVDVTDMNAVSSLLNDLGPMDILVNAVGWVATGDMLTCAEADWNRSWEVNVTSMYRMIRLLLPKMLANGRGSIINVASVVSSLKGVPNRCAYGTTKAAVIGLTKSVAADYVARGVRCNAICPGTVDSPSLEERMKATGDPSAARAAFVARQPMGRIGKPEEIAAAAVYLASDDAEFVTGTLLVVDGGMTL